MNPISISLLATLFSTVGALVGVPSVALLAFYAFQQVTKPDVNATAATHFGSQPDAILLMLKGMTQAIGALAGAASSVAQWLFNALAVVATVSLVLAIACWLTGRGLGAHAPWARVSAAVVLALALLPSLLLALSLQGFGRLLMVVFVAMCLLALHTVWVGYGGHVARSLNP